jgi:hypothetical protein
MSDEEKAGYEMALLAYENVLDIIEAGLPPETIRQVVVGNIQVIRGLLRAEEAESKRVVGTTH